MSPPSPSPTQTRSTLDRITFAVCLAVMLFFALAVVPSILSSHTATATHTVEASNG